MYRFLALLPFLLSFALADAGHALRPSGEAAEVRLARGEVAGEVAGGEDCPFPGDTRREAQPGGHWASDTVAFAARCGLLKGVRGDLSAADYDRPVTPEEWNAMVAALLGVPAGPARDVDYIQVGDANLLQYWVWSYSGGLATGEDVHREWAVGGLIKLLIMFTELPLPGAPAEFDRQHLGRFRDAYKIGDHNRALLAVAASLGLVGGYPDGSLRPTQPITVAEAATLVRRMRNLIPRMETPVKILDLPLGPEPHLPGATPERVGGVSPGGPLSFSMGSAESIHILDSARGRILRYRKEQLDRIIETPFLGEKPGRLLLHDGLMYVRDGQVEYEIAENGEIRRVGPAGAGTIYPRPRPAGLIVGRDQDVDQATFGREKELALKGHGLGSDASGNSYNIAQMRVVWAIRRSDNAGRETARAPVPPEVVDWYLTPEGGVYALSWTRDGSGSVTRTAVYRVLAPVWADRNGPGGDGSATVPVEPPLAFGLPAPLSLEVRMAGWLPVEIRDRVYIGNLWRLFGRLEPEPAPEWLRASKTPPAFTVTARLPGGAAFEITSAAEGVMCGDIWYRGPIAGATSSLLAGAVFSPENLMLAIASRPVSVAIPDLPGVSRRLNLEERRQLADALKGSFRAGRYEPPQPLEYPFPRYIVGIGLEGGGEADVALDGDRYLSLHGGNTAMAHGGQLARLVREWLPAPGARPEEPAYLYRATRLALDHQGDTQDLTRWKATVVRALLNFDREWYVPIYPEEYPVVLTFTVDERPHTVRITRDGFSYAGKTYQRRGLIQAVLSLRGVP